MNKLDETETLLVQCEKDLLELIRMHQSIKAIEVRRKELDDYYRSQYIHDIDDHANHNHDKPYRILDEDSIWDVLTEQYNEKINLLKTLIQSI